MGSLILICFYSLSWSYGVPFKFQVKWGQNVHAKVLLHRVVKVPVGVDRHPNDNEALDGVNHHPASNLLLNLHPHKLDNNLRISTGSDLLVPKPTAGTGRHSPPVI